MKYHKYFVQISEIFWKKKSKILVWFSYILVTISKVLIEICLHFWKKFDQNLKNLVRNQLKNLKDFVSNQTFCNKSLIFWSKLSNFLAKISSILIKISKMLVKVSQILVEMSIRAKIFNIISPKLGLKFRPLFGRIMDEMYKMWVKNSNIIKNSLKCYLKIDQNLKKLAKIRNFILKRGKRVMA